MTRAIRTPMIIGGARFSSRAFSNDWELVRDSGRIARLRRIPSRHVSLVELADGTRLTLEPEGWGTVIARFDDDDTGAGRIARQSWWGRAWEIQSPGFSCRLTSDPIPRRWSLRFGTEAVGRIAGGYFSYNHVDVQTDVAVPVTSLVLGWHVIARPWEQAAAPGALVARSPSSYRVVPNE